MLASYLDSAPVILAFTQVQLIGLALVIILMIAASIAFDGTDIKKEASIIDDPQMAARAIYAAACNDCNNVILEGGKARITYLILGYHQSERRLWARITRSGDRLMVEIQSSSLASGDDLMYAETIRRHFAALGCDTAMHMNARPPIDAEMYVFEARKIDPALTVV